VQEESQAVQEFPF